MRALLQRVRGCEVRVQGDRISGFTGPGLLVLVGVTHDDTATIASKLADKVAGLRIFEQRHASPTGSTGPTNARELSVSDLHLPAMVVSQFTLYADTHKGRRPTWDDAAPRTIAEPLVDGFVRALENLGVTVETGRFGADMMVDFSNDGPMTVMLEVDDPAGRR